MCNARDEAPERGKSLGLDEIPLGFAGVQRRLGKYKWPQSIDFVDELPREPTGKLLKRKLRDPYWQGRDRAI